MHFSSPKHPFTLQALLIAAGLFASLCLGACSRTSHITDSLVGPTREGSLAFARGGNGKGHQQPPPAAPALSSPADGAVDVALAPTLAWIAWIASAGATNYRLQVSTGSAFSSTIFDQSGISATSAGVTGLSAGTQYFWRVSATNAGGSSAFSAPFGFTTAPPAVSADPCASLNGLGGSVVSVFASIPQFRVNRLRVEVVGDVTAGTIDALGACVPSPTPAVQFSSGTGIVTLSGSGTPVTTTGGSITFGPLLVPVIIEPGVVLVIDPTGNVLEIIWPGLAGLPPGPPILRLQLASYSTAVQAGVSLDHDTVTVGDVILLRVRVHAPEGATINFPTAVDSLGPVGSLGPVEKSVGPPSATMWRSIKSVISGSA